MIHKVGAQAKYQPFSFCPLLYCPVSLQREVREMKELVQRATGNG